MGKVLVFDGAMGTLLQAAGLPPGLCPDAWCLQNPDAVAEAHRRYVNAGAQVIETNTFGASPIRLSHYGLAGKVKDINVAAVRLARQAAGGRAQVAASIGPLGVLMEPLGDFTFDEAYEQFAVQVKALASAGPDFIIIETVADLNEMRAAILACKDFAPDIKLIAQMTVESLGRSYTGTDPETAALVMQSLGADVVGLNCSVGPDILVGAIDRMAKVAEVPLSVMPNAGMPRLVKGQTTYPMGPEEFASYAPRLVEAGASVVGGCCGTTPEHIRLVASAVSGMESPGVRGEKRLGLASRTRFLIFHDPVLPVIIGERINPTGRKALSQDIKEGAFQLVKQEARKQVGAGARVLDVNVGVPLIDEPSAMERAVRAVQEAVSVPVAVDSTSPEAIEAGLRAFVGTALINSVTAEKAKAQKVLPLAARYGASVVGLTMDEGGLPETASERVKMAEKLLEMASSYGIPPHRVVIDPLALTAGAEQSQAVETLKAIKPIKALGCLTSLGISNVSYGLPDRSFLNSVYMSMALTAGLDMAIVNPLDVRMMDTVRAVRVFLNRDIGSAQYINGVRGREEAPPVNEAAKKDPEPKGGEAPAAKSPTTGGQHPKGQLLYEAVLQGDKERALTLLRCGLGEEFSPLVALNDYLIPAITEVGRLFGQGIYFLPQLMLSASAMKSAVDFLKPRLSEGQDLPRVGTVVFATVQGDMHDIGKNIVSVLLENHGVNVVDLGRDVPSSVILKEARSVGADAVCLSALMTTTMPRMREVVDLFAQEGFDCPVLVGGAAITRAFAVEIGASGYGRDAQEAVTEVLRVIKEGKRR